MISQVLGVAALALFAALAVWAGLRQQIDWIRNDPWAEDSHDDGIV